jgi:ubiquilin
MSSWTLTVRLSSGERFTVDVSSTISVQQCKDQIASVKSDLPANRQRLVYKGRILDDNDRPLSDYGIVNQATIFLVMSTATTAPSTTTSTSTSTTATTGTPSLFNPWGGSMASSNSINNPMALNMTGGGPSATGFPNGIRMMMNNNNPPSTDQSQMQAMMNSPMMQAMMENPEMMRAALQMSMQQNPQLRALMESNPEMRQMMQDPAMIDQFIQMMRNPAFMQQQMRNQELAMSQLENIPGGFSALSSMYRTIQEPLMDAQINDAANDVSYTGSNTNANNNNDGATGAAMPNPWGSPSSNTNTNSSNVNTMPNPWAMPPTAGGAFPPMNPQNINSMDPNQMMAMLDNPMVAQMMQQVADQNPDMVRQLLEAQNPMLRQLFQNNPEMGNQMIRQMMNPAALRAMVQLQQAMGGTNGLSPTTTTTTTTAPPVFQPGGLDFTNLLSGGGDTGMRGSYTTNTTVTSTTTPTPTMTNLPGNPMDFSTLIQQLQGMQGFGEGGMSGMLPTGAANQQEHLQQQQHPADRYRTQLQSLRDMGFDDEQQCLTVLQQHLGNLNRAVDALLMAPSPTTASSSTTPAPATTSIASISDDAVTGTSTTTNHSTNNNINHNNNQNGAGNEEPNPKVKDATEKKND